MKILVTGAAGFIGHHLSLRLLREGHEVTGADNLNDYYDVNLKLARLARLSGMPGFRFQRVDLADSAAAARLFQAAGPAIVVHLAAQAGVRYSIENPHTYVRSNLTAFVNVLEECVHARAGHLVFASSSSVYGANVMAPFSTRDSVDRPVSLYAATKKSNELMAHCYSHLHGLPVTGLRFFTVYGPWGRPDMAYYKFAEAIEAGRPIDVYNYGKMRRDFTYIDDVVEGIERVMTRPPRETQRELDPEGTNSQARYKIYNLGNRNPVDLSEFIDVLGRALGKPVHKRLLPMQPGDVPVTWADIDELTRDTGFLPTTPVDVGLPMFVDWFLQYGALRERAAC